MFTVYILQNLAHKYYTGVTSDTVKRLLAHNSGANKYTRHGRPWEIIYTEIFASKSEAWSRERQIKKYKGGEVFKKLLGLK